MAWLRGILFGLQFLVLFLWCLPSPAKCGPVGKLFPPSPSPSPAPKPLKPTYNVSVEGVVYCRCKLPGYLKPKDASPLPGAPVNLKCGKLSVSGKTDTRGYFLLDAKFPLLDEKLMKRYVAKWCKVYVVSTPLPACIVPEFLGPKGKGASVYYERNLVAGSGYVALFSAGFLELGPASSKMCHT
ncbi:pistil-specific extensin-like protein [Phoenix dactylifera]|uniref:Pistil-specific extensin-like protein n=1 Tax=Phoenix dactylifera TaxID=42345 RepID=A0A8B9AMV2_PHODC|nr:pistil-specific extensin-like protein [Phoenix dactylifera]XP_038988086.1 pistil-specific extensin-like protein [Phoenix dactylifera]